MHQTLLISEAIEAILEPLSKQDLWECTRVCKAWHQPSIHLLWNTMVIFDPLLKLLGTITQDLESETWVSQCS